MFANSLSLGVCCEWLCWRFELNPTHHSMFQKSNCKYRCRCIHISQLQSYDTIKRTNKQTNPKKTTVDWTHSFKRKRYDFSSFAVYTYDKQLSGMFIWNSETTTMNERERERENKKNYWSGLDFLSNICFMTKIITQKSGWIVRRWIINFIFVPSDNGTCSDVCYKKKCLQRQQ